MNHNVRKSNFGKFLLLWTGELISSVGGGLTSFGLGVYVFGQTGSAASMALVTLLAFLPTLILSVPAGVLADRYDRRLLMMLGDGCSALGIIYILICMMNGGASLLQICIGVFVSSVFSSLLEPSYRATVSDLLTKEEFSKANGLVSLAGSARYLISPLVAGLLLSISDVKLLLIIDISTFVLTVISTAVVKKGIETKSGSEDKSFMESLKEGWNVVHSKQGIFLLILVSAVMTLFLGVFQILAEPLILSFADSKTLGIGETVCACGMLVSSLILGVRGIKKRYVKVLAISLMCAGLFMIGFGIWENIFVICGFGFLFFAMLPFANNCLDYLVRTNIPDKLQGRAWGFIGFLSQMGYVIAYGAGGLLADLAAKLLDTSIGRGAGMVIMISGVCLSVVAVMMARIKSIQDLEMGKVLNSQKKEESY
ncbi:MAG: MFS transporter [Eubacterium sp.]|nr:MFS transporter [Eubacterium sp.]